MDQELKLLEEFLNIEYHNLSCYSKGLDQAEAKEGFEEEWSQTKDRIDQIVRIMKIVNAESHAIKEEDRKNLVSVAERLLNESASAYIIRGANSTEVRIIDEVQRSVIARFKIKISFKHLLFKEYHFF